MNIFERHHTIQANECDMFSLWRPGAVMVAMQETASEHSSILGVGMKEMTENGIAWVLSRGRVQMHRMPHCSERITIRTYPLAPRHLFWPRVHIFFDEQGVEIGQAVCLWLVMDMTDRRAVKNSYVESRMPLNRELSCSIGMPATVYPIDAPCVKRLLEPQFTDADCLGHVNNTRYLDWCCNALGYPVMKDYYLSSFEVNYTAETRLSEQLTTALCLQGEHFSYTGCMDDTQHFAISGRLTPRDAVK